MITPCTSEARDVTEAVLDAMLNEALDLTDEIAAVGALRRAVGAPDSFDCALRLRMAARLSRIAAWASLRISDDPERLAIADSALSSASAPTLQDEPALGAALETSELAPFNGMVERLVERALRLDALLSGQGAASCGSLEPVQSEEGSASILPFRRPSREQEEERAEQASEAP